MVFSHAAHTKVIGEMRQPSPQPAYTQRPISQAMWHGNAKEYLLQKDFRCLVFHVCMWYVLGMLWYNFFVSVFVIV